MDEERFEELFTDVERWILQARRLKIAGDKLVPAYEYQLNQNLLDSDGIQRQSPQFLDNVKLQRAYGDACALLWGLAIENAIKARQIHDGYITVKNGRAKNLHAGHDLIEMVKRTHYKPTQDEIDYLELLSYQIRVLAKYSIAKDLKTQSKFTGRVVGGSAFEAQFVNNILRKILGDSELVNIFMHGYLSKSVS